MIIIWWYWINSVPQPLMTIKLTQFKVSWTTQLIVTMGWWHDPLEILSSPSSHNIISHIHLPWANKSLFWLGKQTTIRMSTPKMHLRMLSKSICSSIGQKSSHQYDKKLACEEQSYDHTPYYGKHATLSPVNQGILIPSQKDNIS